MSASYLGGDRGSVQDFLTEAREVAGRTPDSAPDTWSNFGPIKVELPAVNASVVLGDAGLALDASRPPLHRHIPVPERRAALGTDVAPRAGPRRVRPG